MQEIRFKCAGKNNRFMPGKQVSRDQNFLSILLDVAGRMKGAQFVLPVSSSKFKIEIESKIAKLPIKIMRDRRIQS